MDKGIGKQLKSMSLIMILPVMIIVGTQVALLSISHQVFAQVEDGQQIIQQGIATSSPDPLPGHEAHQSITILRLRDDNGVYSGRITFTTTQPVEVQILHRDMTNAGAAQGSATPNIPEGFGALAVLDLPGGNGQVTITNVVPKFTEGAAGSTFAASVPFSGNAIALHNLEGQPFVATYTATADVLGPGTRADDIASEEQQPNEEQESEEQQPNEEQESEEQQPNEEQQ